MKSFFLFVFCCFGALGQMFSSTNRTAVKPMQILVARNPLIVALQFQAWLPPCYKTVHEWLLLSVFRAAYECDTLRKRINPLWLDSERYFCKAGLIGVTEGSSWGSVTPGVSGCRHRGMCVCVCVWGWCPHLTGRTDILKPRVSDSIVSWGFLYLHPVLQNAALYCPQLVVLIPPPCPK